MKKIYKTYVYHGKNDFIENTNSKIVLDIDGSVNVGMTFY